MSFWAQSIPTSARRIYEAYGFRLAESMPHDAFGAPLIGEIRELELKQAAAKSAVSRTD